MQINGLLYGAKLLRHVGFPTSELLGPDATEDQIQALIHDCGATVRAMKRTAARTIGWWQAAAMLAAMVASGAGVARPAESEASHAAPDIPGSPRTLPKPEPWQPALDERLPPYVPCPIGSRRTLSGSTPPIMPALVEAWMTEFRERQPEVSFQLGPPWLPPQGRLNPALKEFLEGRRDFAFLSREPSVADVRTFVRHHGHAPLVIPVAMGSWRHFGFVDAVGIVVNAENPIRSLSLAQVDALFSRSRLRGHPPVRHWGELGVAEWTGRPINVVGAAAWQPEESARALSVRREVMAQGGREGQWRQDLDDGGHTEAQIPQQVAADRHAIGFTGLGHLVPGIRAVDLSIETGAPAVPADHRHVASGEYPLSRRLYLLVDPVPEQAPDPVLADFALYLLSRQGQQVVADHGVFIPLRDRQVAALRRQLEAMRPDCD